MSVEYWKARCKLAEDTLEKWQDAAPASAPAPLKDREEDAAGVRAETTEALQLLMTARIDANESFRDIVSRLIDYASDRSLALSRARGAGQFSGPDEPEIAYLVAPLVERLLSDLSSGRTTIEFLSRPPKMRLDTLPVGAVFVHAGQLYESKREPLESEAGVVCFVWNRDERPANVDRRELVTPLGKVVFDDRRKTIRLGLLEVVAESQLPAPSFLDAPAQLGPKR